LVTEIMNNLEAGGLDEWPEPSLRQALTSLETDRARLDAAQAQVLAELVRRGRTPEAMFGNKLSIREASRRTKTALALNDGSLPGAARLLAAGEITFEHAAALAEARPHLHEDQIESLLERARELPPDKFRRRLHQASIPRERVAEGFLTKLSDGGMQFRLTVDRYDGEVVVTALNKVLDQQWRAEHPEREATKTELPPYAQRLAQAFLEMCRRISSGNPPSPPHDDTACDTNGGDANLAGEDSMKKPGGWTNPTPEAFFLIPYPMMLLDAEAAGICTTINGDPIPAAVVRKMLVDAKIYPVVLSGEGEILDFGRGRRLFSATQRKAMAVRDGTCQFADCDKPIPYTQAHHTVPWSRGGLTNLGDGAPVCDEHHGKLTEGGYRIERRDGKTYTYDPNGTRIYVRDNRWRL
jgi:hypothetical protein